MLSDLKKEKIEGRFKESDLHWGLVLPLFGLSSMFYLQSIGIRKREPPHV